MHRNIRCLFIYLSYYDHSFHGPDASARTCAILFLFTLIIVDLILDPFIPSLPHLPSRRRRRLQDETVDDSPFSAMIYLFIYLWIPQRLVKDEL